MSDQPHIPPAGIVDLHSPAPAYLPIAGADPKPLWQSRGAVGAICVIVAQILAFVGLQVEAGLLTELVLQLVTLIAGIVALVGRLKASQPIA